MLIIRVNTNGTLDNSFDGDGISLTQWGNYAPNAGASFAIELQNDGKIVLGGSHDVGVFSARMIVARYNTNGSLDNTFAKNGIFDIHIATS